MIYIKEIIRKKIQLSTLKIWQRYLSQNGEYIEAISYYSKLREMFRLKEDGFDSSEYCLIGYNEALCYQNLRKSEEAYSILSEIIDMLMTLKQMKAREKYIIYMLQYALSLKKIMLMNIK